MNEGMKEKGTQVSYLVYESALARMERTKARLWSLFLMEFILLLVSNLAWIIHFLK